MKGTICAYLLLFFCVGACIPVEDRLAPKIQQIEFDGQEVLVDIDKENDAILTDTLVYHLLDTMTISVRYSDNEQIDSIALLINQGSGIIEDIKPLIRKYVSIPGGRLYQSTIQVPIPADANQGIYHINIECYDLAKNRIRTYGLFRIKSDEKKPTIEGFKLRNISKNQDGNYLVCRSQKIDLEGLATDNIAISKVKVTLGNETRVRDVSNIKTVNLRNLFGSDIVVPSSTNNSRILPMTLTVIDNHDNFTSIEVNLAVDCDDEKPILNINRINPRLRNGNIDVVKGSTVSILDGYITDNFMLDRMAITFNLQGSTRDTVFSKTLLPNPADTIFVHKLPRQANTFSIPKNAILNSTYELIFYLLDTAQNFALYNYKLNVVRDNVPHISVVESFLLNSEFVVNANDLKRGTIKLNPGDLIKVPGEITDNNIQYIRVYWGLAGSPRLQYQVLDKDLEKPYDSYRFAEPNNHFRIPSSAVSGSKYELRIEVKDLTNPPDSETYFFYVK